MIALFLLLAIAACDATKAGPDEDRPPVRGQESQPQAQPSLIDWPDGEYEYYLHEVQAIRRSRSQVATGENGAVTVALNGFAARAGLEALRQGGSAADAALTAALTQVAITAGGPVSYFGTLSLVYFDADAAEVTTLNADWNTIRAETDPMSIPGSIRLSDLKAMLGTTPSGRTALVGGFMKGVEAAHRRYGVLPFSRLFEPAIYIAEDGFPVRQGFSQVLASRADDLSRLPETRAVFTKEDGSFYEAGDVLRQPALAHTLRAIVEHGADYMYGGPWGEKLVSAVRADGGHMTLEDLRSYEVLWREPLVAKIGDFELRTSPQPNDGGTSLVEALNLALAADLPTRGHWSQSGHVLRDAVDIGMASHLRYRTRAALTASFPGLDFSPAARTTAKHAAELWRLIRAGARITGWQPPSTSHSDDVVAIDSQGNVAAITHTINSVAWGKTAIMVDGISIGDPASFQQAAIARVGPGRRLPSRTETGIVMKDGIPVLGFASMGSGLHQRTLQALLNIIGYGMTVDQAIDAPDSFLPQFSARGARVQVPAGRFPRHVLDSMGYAYDEIDMTQPRFAGDGIWVAIHRDPKTGELRAASNNRKNGAAVAF
ncbi:MAG: gamma-glutamyltransferase [Thermoanaerobaculia bacterium]|nr:gamma-glutamyltransferase [Thermoanaerobaculia bacterium]